MLVGICWISSFVGSHSCVGFLRWIPQPALRRLPSCWNQTSHEHVQKSFRTEGNGFFFQTFNVRFCCRNGSEYLGHQVDFRSSKIGAADGTNVSVPVPVGDSNGIYNIIYT